MIKKIFNFKVKINYPLILNIIFDSIISYYIISLLVKDIQIPNLTNNFNGIVSWLTIENINPRFDYFKFILIVLTLTINFVYNLNKKKSFYIGAFYKLKINDLSPSYLINPLSVILVGISLILSFVSFSALHTTSVEPFGMGQTMGYTANATKYGLYLSPGYFIHGVFHDFYISMISSNWEDLSIKIFLFINNCINGIISLLFFITIIIYLHQDNRTKFYIKLIIVSLTAILLNKILFFIYSAQIYQLILALQFLFFVCFIYSKKYFLKSFFCFCIGNGIVLGFLINIASAMVCLTSIILITPLIYFNKGIFKIWTFNILFGISSSLIVLFSLFGYDQVHKYVENIFSLIRYSGILYNYPIYFPLQNLSGETHRWNFIDISIDIYKFIFIHLMCIIFYFHLYAEKGKKIFSHNKFLCILFIQITCLIYFRASLDGSDAGHVKGGISPSFIPLCLVAYEFILFHFKKNKIEKSILFAEKNFLKLLSIIFLVFILSLWQPVVRYNFGAFALIPFKNHEVNKNVALLNDEQKNVYQYLSNNLDSKKDYLYTMNNEAIWHHLTKTPSPSWCIIPYYCARTFEDQKRLINGLKKNKPKFIVMDSNYYWNKFDGVTKFNSYYLIIDFILKNYVPDKKIGSYSIWKFGNTADYENKNIASSLTQITLRKDRTFNNDVYYEILIPSNEIFDKKVSNELYLITEYETETSLINLIWYKELDNRDFRCEDSSCEFNFVEPRSWINLIDSEIITNFIIIDPKNRTKYVISNK